MSILDSFEGDIRRMVNSGFTHARVSDTLIGRAGEQRGFSESNVRYFCKKNCIHRFAFGEFDREYLTDRFSTAVSSVGPTFGRKMITGYMRSVGINVGERMARQMLRDITPVYLKERLNGTARQVNPVPYFAEYPGHKLHMDQNEKLQRFGVTHVIANDGFSGKIMAWSTMPIKNNLVIYEEVYRKTCVEFGLFDTLRVDHGKEFYLCLYQQDNLDQYRTKTHRPPYLQTQSKQNHTVERLWVEVNSRVNYPAKRCLLLMEENGDIDMKDEMVRYCVSQLTIQITSIAMRNMVASWNSHCIPGKGIPNNLFLENCMTAKIAPHLLPPAGEVCAQYEGDGGELTHFPVFGRDPLAEQYDASSERDNLFSQSFPRLEPIVSNLLNRDAVYFQEAILLLIDITDRLS